MENELLPASKAARRLGISRGTLYDWLHQSDAGDFVIRGQPHTISYYQGGRRGQGRILLDPREVERLLELMRAGPRPQRIRRPPKSDSSLRHISRIGRPDD